MNAASPSLWTGATHESAYTSLCCNDSSTFFAAPDLLYETFALHRICCPGAQGFECLMTPLNSKTPKMEGSDRTGNLRTDVTKADNLDQLPTF